MYIITILSKMNSESADKMGNEVKRKPAKEHKRFRKNPT